MLIFPHLNKRMGVCITLRICRVSNEDEMLIIQVSTESICIHWHGNNEVILGSKVVCLFVAPPHLHINIYCFLIGSICIHLAFTIGLAYRICHCIGCSGSVCFKDAVICFVCMFCDRRTTSTCSCVWPSSCCTAKMSQSSSSLQIKCCCTLVTSPCT